MGELPARDVAPVHICRWRVPCFSAGNLACIFLSAGHVRCGQVWEGNGVVASARKLIGATNPLNAEPGTIRGDLAIQTGRNVVHGSDSPENGERETGVLPLLSHLCHDVGNYHVLCA